DRRGTNTLLRDLDVSVHCRRNAVTSASEPRRAAQIKAIVWRMLTWIMNNPRNDQESALFV
ncbi:hypothetical protein R0J89_19640, partial [Psychrobacter sp. SIMBA_152]